MAKMKTKKVAPKKAAKKVKAPRPAKPAKKAPKKEKAAKPKKAAEEKAPKASAFADAPKKDMKGIEISKEAYEMVMDFADDRSLKIPEAFDKVVRAGVARLKALSKYATSDAAAALKEKAAKPAKAKKAAPVADDEDEEDED